MSPDDPDDEDPPDPIAIYEDPLFDELDLEAVADEDDPPLCSDPLERLPDEFQKLYDVVEASAGFRRDFAPDQTPPRIGRFELLDALLGGMGLVIKARDRKLDRHVALKFWCRSGPEANAALRREAQILAKLSHPNVVTIHGTDRWREWEFFVMEWIEGADGHKWMEARRPWAEIRDVFVEAGKGLAAAHDLEIQHRDFKPSNMLVGNDGRVVVADFGVAASLDELDGDGDGGKIVGTPCYMAPERLAGGRGDARSDQYSFCAAIWRALYETRPYAGETREELLAAIGRKELRIGLRRRYVPIWLKHVVRKGLATAPDERYPDMHTLVRALLDGPAGDDERTGSDFGEAVLQRNGGLLNAPREESESLRRWLAFGYGVVTTSIVVLLGVAMFGLGEPRWASEPERAPVEIVEQTAAREDPVVAEVIELIRQGKVDDADNKWQAELNWRIASGEPYGDDMVRIGSALLNQARAFAGQHEPEQASEAAGKAARYALRASKDLTARQQSTATVDTLLDEITEFYGSLTIP